MKSLLEKIEKEFDEKFPATHSIYPSEKNGYLTISEASVSTDELKSFLTNAIANALAECEPSKSESHTGYKTQYERQIFCNAQNMMLADYKEKRKRFLGL